MQRTTIDELLATARSRIRRYEPAEAAAAMSDGAVLIDLRCLEDRATEGSIEGAVIVPRTVLEWRADPDSEWSDDRIARLDLTLILMCNDGYSSSLGAATLVDMGFAHAGDLAGGFRAWRTAGLPVVRTTPDD
jgi:rhodanese-related sulfurtransferase